MRPLSAGVPADLCGFDFTLSSAKPLRRATLNCQLGVALAIRALAIKSQISEGKPVRRPPARRAALSATDTFANLGSKVCNVICMRVSIMLTVAAFLQLVISKHGIKISGLHLWAVPEDRRGSRAALQPSLREVKLAFFAHHLSSRADPGPKQQIQDRFSS